MYLKIITIKSEGISFYYFKATTQSLKKEIASESHASLFKTHNTMKMQWAFLLGKKSYNF